VEDLKSIIADVPNGFRSFRGAIRHSGENDTTFTSTLIVKGAIDAQINSGMRRSSSGDEMLIGDPWYYAIISKSEDRSKLKTTLKDWKKKLSAALGNGYTSTSFARKRNVGVFRGYGFSNGKVYIEIASFDSDEDRGTYLFVTRHNAVQGR
jgi:hypothetical protein